MVGALSWHGRGSAWWAGQMAGSATATQTQVGEVPEASGNGTDRPPTRCDGTALLSICDGGRRSFFCRSSPPAVAFVAAAFCSFQATTRGRGASSCSCAVASNEMTRRKSELDTGEGSEAEAAVCVCAPTATATGAPHPEIVQMIFFSFQRSMRTAC